MDQIITVIRSDAELVNAQTSVEVIKRTVTNLLNRLKREAFERQQAQKRWIVAKQTQELKPSPKHSATEKIAEQDHARAVVNYDATEAEIFTALKNGSTAVKAIVDCGLLRPRKANAFFAGYERFRAKMTEQTFELGRNFKREKTLFDIERDTQADAVPPAAEPQGEPQSAPAVESHVETPEPASVVSPAASSPMYYDEARPTVNLAPITLDISSYVDRAVNAAMDRFSMSFSRRMDNFASDFALPAGSAVDPKNAELAASVGEAEAALFGKLQGILDALTDMNKNADILLAKMQELNVSQQQTNDVQRHTARDQQGIVVNQRVIAGEQNSVREQQNALAAQQKTVIDGQNAISELQAAVTAQQKALAEAQAAVNESLKSVLAQHKEVLAGQTTILQNTAKCMDAQADLNDKQSAVTQMQKELAQMQKQVAREQKALAEKSAKPTAKKAEPIA